MNKKEERKIRITDLKQTYEKLERAGEGMGCEDNVHKKELQLIKNAIKFLEAENGK